MYRRLDFHDVQFNYRIVTSEIPEVLVYQVPLETSFTRDILSQLYLFMLNVPIDDTEACLGTGPIGPGLERRHLEDGKF